MKPKNILITGLILLAVSLFMLFWGVYMFTYQGNYTKFMGITGMGCFLLWLPTLIISLRLIVIANRKKQTKISS